MTALDVRDLSVHFGDVPVVQDLTFALQRGDRVGLIGESGSGKSMAALAIMGLLPEGAVASGHVAAAGTSLLDLPERDLARLRGSELAMVFQEPMTALDPVMAVGAQVAAAVTLHNDVSRAAARARALELLHQVELPDPERAMRCFPHQLSGGQRQRVVLAMALANDPSVLICDEPTTALDVTIQRRMLGLLERLVSERDSALLFITHDLAVVSELCDVVLVLYGGRLVEHGPIARVFGAPRHPYTAGLLAASDLSSVAPGAPLATIAGSVPGLGAFPIGCPFRNRCPRVLPACAEVPPLTADRSGRAFACFNPEPARRTPAGPR
jgi:peptide/nickel transport system ATP-binding protein